MPAIAELPDIDQALAKLDAAEASFQDGPTEAFVQTESRANRDQSGSSEAAPGAKPPAQHPTDTRATAGAPPKPDAKPISEIPPKPGDKPAEAKPGEKPPEGSAFKRDRERLDKNWKSVNERKQQLDTQEQQLKAREQQIVTREQQFKLQQARAQQRFTPEQYEQASQTKLQNAEQFGLQADGLERRADKLEEAGNFAGAEQARVQAKQLREQAVVEAATGRQLKDYAGHLRANPDPTIQQHQQQLAKQMEHYTIEAAKRWPEMGQSGSEFQKSMAANLNAAAKYGLDANEHPAVMFFAAQLTAFERAAARVPDMEKELGELRAKVKDYEKLTAPGGGSEATARPQAGKPASQEDDGEALRQEAMAYS